MTEGNRIVLVALPQMKLQQLIRPTTSAAFNAAGGKVKRVTDDYAAEAMAFRGHERERGTGTGINIVGFELGEGFLIAAFTAGDDDLVF